MTGDGLSNWYDANLAGQYGGGGGSPEPGTGDIMALMNQPAGGTIPGGGTEGGTGDFYDIS